MDDVFAGAGPFATISMFDDVALSDELAVFVAAGFGDSTCFSTGFAVCARGAWVDDVGAVAAGCGVTVTDRSVFAGSGAVDFEMERIAPQRAAPTMLMTSTAIPPMYNARRRRFRVGRFGVVVGVAFPAMTQLLRPVA